MWADIATGAGVLIVGGTMFKILWDKVGSKQDKNMCDVLHKELKESNRKMEKRFDKVEEKLENQITAISEVNTTLAVLASAINKQNGNT